MESPASRAVAIQASLALSDLIRLGLAPHLLKIHFLRKLRMPIDMVTATGPSELESECLDEPLEVAKRDVSHVTPGAPPQQLSGSHGELAKELVVARHCSIAPT